MLLGVFSALSGPRGGWASRGAVQVVWCRGASPRVTLERRPWCPWCPWCRAGGWRGSLHPPSWCVCRGERPLPGRPGWLLGPKCSVNTVWSPEVDVCAGHGAQGWEWALGTWGPFASWDLRTELGEASGEVGRRSSVPCTGQRSQGWGGLPGAGKACPEPAPEARAPVPRMRRLPVASLLPHLADGSTGPLECSRAAPGPGDSWDPPPLPWKPRPSCSCASALPCWSRRPHSRTRQPGSSGAALLRPLAGGRSCSWGLGGGRPLPSALLVLAGEGPLRSPHPGGCGSASCLDGLWESGGSSLGSWPPLSPAQLAPHPGNFLCRLLGTGRRMEGVGVVPDPGRASAVCGLEQRTDVSGAIPASCRRPCPCPAEPRGCQAPHPSSPHSSWLPAFDLLI